MKHLPYQRFAGPVLAFGSYGLPSIAGFRLDRRLVIFLGLLGVLLALRILGLIDDHGLLLAAGPTTLAQSLQGEANELEQEREALITTAEARARNGGERGFTDTERDRIKAIDERLEAIDKDVELLEQSRERRTNAPAIPDLPEAAAAMAVGPVQRPASGPFSSLQDFLTSVKAAAFQQQKGKAVDPRLHQVEEAFGIQAATGANETVGADGGFLVQKDLQEDLLSSMWEQSNLASRTRKLTVGARSNGIKLNTVDETSRATGSRWGGVRVYWTAEGGQKTASRPKVKPLEMQLQKLAGFLVATDELLEDSAYEQFAREAFSEEMAFALDDAIIRGTGVGMPLGILNAGATVSQAAEGGQAADTFIAENVWSMYARLPARSLARAEWYINQALIPQMAQLQLAVGTGGVPLYIPSGGIADAPFGRLMGRPVNFIEQASAPGDVGDVILADLGEYLLIQKGGIQTASSIHVYFDTDETAFRWVWRVNGQPRWQSAITPYKGTPTVSPFVTLAAR